jgi:acyl carrier protein
MTLGSPQRTRKLQHRPQPSNSTVMEFDSAILQTLDDVLALEGRSLQWTRQTPLLGAVPELDSMAVVSLLTELAARFDIMIDDDDFSGDVFATVGSLSDFVSARCRP